MTPHHVSEDSTPVFKRDTEILSVRENQPEHQIHSQYADFDNESSPLIQDSGSGSLDNKDNEGSTLLGDRGTGSSLAQQTNVTSRLRRRGRGRIF